MSDKTSANFSSLNPQLSDDYLRGWRDAQKAVKTWFWAAYRDIDKNFEIDAASNIPQDPGITPVPEGFVPEVFAKTATL